MRQVHGDTRNANEKNRQIFECFHKVERLESGDSIRVCYQGVPGAFAEQATIAFFGDECDTINVKSFRDVMIALEEGKADYGVLPIENSSAGNVESNYDLLGEYDMTIVGEQIIAVNQALLALPGTKLSDIRTVYSHPQGLMQCAKYLEDTDWRQVSMLNTALSAKKVQEDQDSTQAAIASVRAAQLYGLEVLNPSINTVKNNATRFIILSKSKIYEKKANKIGITFGLPHESGSLYNILGFFNEHHLNMTMIESRPIPNRQWEYYFYIEFIGNLEDEHVQQALMGMAEMSIQLRILGNYITSTML